MLDEPLLQALVGARLEVRPSTPDVVAGRPLAGTTTPDGAGWERPVQVTVIGLRDHSQLEVTADDERVLELDGADVVAETSSQFAVFQIDAELQVVVPRRRSAICLLVPRTAAEVDLRRKARRVHATIPVLIATRSTPGGPIVTRRTLSVDLSTGGVKVRDGGALESGAAVTIVLHLPAGPVEIECQTVGKGRDGSASLRFTTTPPQVARYLDDLERGSRTIGEIAG